jgi:hypothetical protein
MDSEEGERSVANLRIDFMFSDFLALAGRVTNPRISSPAATSRQVVDIVLSTFLNIRQPISIVCTVSSISCNIAIDRHAISRYSPDDRLYKPIDKHRLFKSIPPCPCGLVNRIQLSDYLVFPPFLHVCSSLPTYGYGERADRYLPCCYRFGSRFVQLDSLQPNPQTFAHQLTLWNALVLQYSKHHRVFSLDLSADLAGMRDVFENKALHRMFSFY